MEKFTIPIYLFYYNSNYNSLGESSANANANANPNPNPPQNVNQPIYYGNGFYFNGRVYTIDDPTNVINKGYLDPNTMRPFNMSSQPYAINLVNAMAHNVQNINPTI